jgi:hypothetical protein
MEQLSAEVLDKMKTLIVKSSMNDWQFGIEYSEGLFLATLILEDGEEVTSEYCDSLEEAILSVYECLNVGIMVS